MPLRWRSACFLHGLGSSPLGVKASFFRARFADEEVPYAAPDLNVPSFAGQTISAQLEVIRQTLEGLPRPALLIGSSLGGLAAIRYAYLHPQEVGGVMLIAPVTEFRGEPLARFSGSSLGQWKTQGSLQVHRDGEPMAEPLLYDLVEDAAQHASRDVRLEMPVLGIHGAKDAIIPWEETDRFLSRQQNGSSSLLLGGDHSLNDKLDILWSLFGSWRLRITSESARS